MKINSFHRYILANLLVIICLQYSSAQEKEALAKLSFMTGDWKGVSTSFNGDTKKEVEVTEKAYYIMDGDLLILDVKSPNIELHTVISYSVKEKTYYYHPFSKKGRSSAKGIYKNNMFIVNFSSTKRLIFKRNKSGAFQEYGENLVNGKWEKYFEDILYSTTKR